MGEPEVVIFNDVEHWRSWLDRYESDSTGVWLVLAKKGVISPTSLRYDQALLEALCSGWIDGRRRSLDEHTFVQHFTPRRKASVWSQRNTKYVQELIEQGRMRERGFHEIELAKADGRWEQAYQGQADAKVPEDLQAEFDNSPAAAAAFALLKSQERYHILHQLMIARTAKTRQARLLKFVGELASKQLPPSSTEP